MSGLKDILFGSGGKQESGGSSSGLQIGSNASTSFGLTGSESAGSSFGQSSSQQSIGFEDLFRSLYGGASAAAAGIDPAAIGGQASQLFSGGLGFLQQLQGNPGTDALAARVSDTGARDAQLEALRGQLGDFFNEQVLPGITGTGVSTGTLGGSRDSVLRAQAAKAVGGQFAQGAAQIIGTDQGQRDQAAAQLAGVTGQNAATGLGGLSELLGIGTAGQTAQLAPYQMLAQILGGPTVLGSSQSSDISQQIANSFGKQGSQSYGFDFGTQNSSNYSFGTGPTQGLAQAFLGGGGVTKGF